MLYQILQRIDNPYVMLALRLAVYLLCLCAFIHVSGSVWFAVGEADETGSVYQYDGIFATWPLSYVGSCHWAVTGCARQLPQARCVSIALPDVHHSLGSCHQ